MTPASVAASSTSNTAGDWTTPAAFNSRISAWVVSLAFAFYAARFFHLISRWAVNIFFWDQWDLDDATLFQHHSLWEIFTWQPGPQRQGLGGLLMKVIEPYFHWNSRIESFVVGAIIVATAVLALLLKYKVHGRFSLFDVIIPIIYFTPRQYENIFVTANIARDSLPALLLILYCLAWTVRRCLLRYALVLCINFLAIYTGFGFFIGFITPLLLVLDYRAQADTSTRARGLASGSLLVSIASLASFFIHYASRPGLDCFSWRPLSPRIYIRFMAVMFANFFAVPGIQRMARLFGLLVLLILATAVAMTIRALLHGAALKQSGGNYQRPLVITALIAFGLLFAANAAYGRACGGLVFALSSRYVIFLEPAIFGFYLYCLGFDRLPIRTLACTGLLIAVLPASLYLDPQWFYFPQQKARWRDCYLQSEDIKKCDKTIGFPIYPAPEATHLKQKLEFLKQTHQNLYADSQ